MSFTVSELLTAPTDMAAEWAVLSQMLREPATVAEVIGVPLEQTDFSSPDTRLIFATVTEQHYRSQPIDPLVIGALVREQLSQFWNAEAARIGELLERRVRDATASDNLLHHCDLVKQLSTKRKLMDSGYKMLAAIGDGKLTAEEIGDAFATEVTQATTGTVRRSELLTWMDCGRQFAIELRRHMKAHRDGLEMGVYTGLPFIDHHTRGIAPGELCFIASEPGAGKTALAWASALGFASRQMPRQPRVGTLVLSMEMNLYASTMRLVQNIAGIDGVRLREGLIADDEYRHFLREWKNREDLPIHWNFASNFRLSQMRALIAEGIRRHNVGFIVIDHFRMIDTDRRYQNMNDADEAKVRFIKENVAKDLNVAVMCLAHTSKIRERGETARPRLSDLRGSGMISAYADQVALLWCPYKYATKEEVSMQFMAPSDMEIDWSKNRFGAVSTGEYTFIAETMRVEPR